jgi:hypothetical protein
MAWARRTLRELHSRPGSILVGLVLCCFLAGPVPAAQAAVPLRAPSPVLADGWKLSKLTSKVYSPFEWAVGNRRRMIQASTLAMCLALYIIWWRRTK